MARGRSASLTIPQLERMLEERRSTVAKLQKKREAIQSKLDALDAQIAAAGGVGDGAGAKRVTKPAVSLTAGGRVRNAMSLGDAIAVALANGAMSVGDIMDAVTAAGYRSGSANFRGIVNQTLIKDKRFQQASRGVYGMA